MHETIWVVVANASEARIFSMKRGKFKFNLIKEFEHPDSRKKTGELISDGIGRYKARDIASGTFSSRTSPKRVEADHFANELAKFLDHERSINKYDLLMLVMPSHFQALLKNHISNPLRQQICGTIAKDYHAANQRELEGLIT